MIKSYSFPSKPYPELNPDLPVLEKEATQLLFCRRLAADLWYRGLHCFRESSLFSSLSLEKGQVYECDVLHIPATPPSVISLPGWRE